MYSGTIFVRQQEPDSDLKLPRSCWAVYDRVDGETTIGEIATTLGLSEPETFAVVRQLQQRDLIEEAVLSYSAHRDEKHGETDQEQDDENGQAVPQMAGDGARTDDVNRTASTSETGADEASESLHLSALWDWLKEATDNVKAYKNTQAFVLMEASDALESVGVGNMEDLEEMERCSDPEVIRALETAIENNVNEHIPERCYR